MKKDEALKRWRSGPDGQDPLPHMTPIPYKTEGSKYGCAGIRIDGPPAFIDAVLSNLKTLLAGENAVTRLELARRHVERRNGYKAGENADTTAEVCYLRLHVRGGEGARMLAYCGGEQIREATETYAKAIHA